MEKATSTSTTREQFGSEADFRARERNRYRSIWQKMFGRDRSDSMDIIIDEANAMNVAIKKELEDGRAQDMSEALDTVDQMPQFQLKGTERVKIEEYARAKTLQVGEAIEANDFYKALLILNRETHKKGIDKETAQVMDEQATVHIKQHVANLAEAKDGGNLVRAITAFDSRIDKGDISPEAANSQEIQKAVSENLISYFRTFAVTDPKVIVEQIEKYTKLGLTEREKIMHVPEVVEFAKKEVISYFRTFGIREPKLFQRVRDAFIQLGVGSNEDFTQLPEIKEYAKQEAISYFKAYCVRDPKVYQGVRDNYVALGIGTIEDFNELPEIQKVAREEIGGYQLTFGATDPRVVRRVIDGFSKLGIELGGEIK